MHGTERTRPEPTESEKKENKPNAAKILRAEKFDVSQQNKNKCRRKTIFLETNQKNLAEENESGMPFILYAVLFSVFEFWVKLNGFLIVLGFQMFNFSF